LGPEQDPTSTPTVTFESFSLNSTVVAPESAGFSANRRTRTPVMPIRTFLLDVEPYLTVSPTAVAHSEILNR
jgi:hypothetical protein